MIHADLSLRAQQGLLLMPKMLQSIEVLQLASAELVGLIEQELQKNETLEIHGADAEQHEFAPPPSPPDRSRDDNWDHGPPRASGAGEDGKQAMLENVAGTPDLLVRHIREQLAWLDLAPALCARVLALAEHLDHRGFLVSSDEELAAVLGGELLEEAIAVLRALDPKGIGARDAVDALLLQLSEQDPDYHDIRGMLTLHLELLASNKLPEVARQMGRPVSEVQALLGKIRQLDPHPASSFSVEVGQPVHPDLVVSLREGELDILVNDADLPSLGINEDYAAMVRAPDVGGEVKRYLRPKLESARNLIHAVEQRRKTLARVGGAVLEHQRAFLREGRTALLPLKMAEIASLLDLHTSTVSRAVAGKYVQTDRGIYRLRDFFDGGRSQAGRAGTKGPGRLGIQERIRELIEGEKSDRPYSDDDLVALLTANQIKVARRTVTKYRKELGIPSSWKRRRVWDAPDG